MSESTVISQLDRFLWEEKYRPQTLNEVVVPQRLKDTFKQYVVEGQIPSLLLTSPSPGTGKTTMAYALCNELGIKPLFINASLNNSIDDIRTTVMQYATTVSLMGDNIKVVILDEADRLSAAAQDSLKGVLEMVSKNCRFILTANSKNKIIEPLQSRCDVVDFTYTPEETKVLGAQMFQRAKQILDAEGVTYNPAVLAKLVMKFSPDNRRIVKALQKYSKANKTIDEGVLGMLAAADTNVLVEGMKGKNFNQVKSWCFDNADRLGDDFYGKLFATMEERVEAQSVPQLFLDINEYQRVHYQVPDKFIHFTALCTQLMMNIKFK